MKSYSSFTLLTYVFISLIFFCSCSKPGHFQEPVIVNHPVFYVIDKIGRITITAQCPAGEVMIGGGYKMPGFHVNLKHIRPESERSWQEVFDGTNVWDDNATECDKNQNPLILEASYPSSLNTWTVTIFNPDVQSNCYHSGDVIEVDCYCVKSSVVHIKTEIDSILSHRSDIEGAPPFLTDTCNCPQNATILAGGFKMQPVDSSKWATRGAVASPLYGSYPYTNPQRKAIAWATDYSTAAIAPVTFTTYVLCSTSGIFKRKVGSSVKITPFSSLTDGPVKSEQVILANGSDIRKSQVVCDQGYFSTGGGYKIIDRGPNAPVQLIAHGIQIVGSASAFINGNEIQYSGWQSNFLGVHNTPNYTWPTTEEDSVYTIQLLKLPNNIEVGINNPADRTCISGYNDGSASIPEIHFKGYAFDHDGTPITGNNLEWKIEGASKGKGEELTTNIDASSGHFNNISQKTEFTISLTATGKNGDKATAAITLVDCYPVINVP